MNSLKPRISRVLQALASRWVLVVLVCVGVGTSTTVTLFHSHALSPLNEWGFIDYVAKIPTQGMVFRNEPIGHEALNLFACDGVAGRPHLGPACGSNYDSRDFPSAGITSADIYPPVFFAITRGVGDSIGFVTGIDQLAGWRLVGSLWLAGTLTAFWALLRAWRVHNLAILALGLVFLGSPLSYWTYSYVTPDASSFLVGALLLYLCTRYLRGQGGGWPILVVASLGASFTIANLIGVGMVALILLIAAVIRARDAAWLFRRGQARWAMTAGLTVFVSVAIQACWLLVDRLAAISAPDAVSLRVPLSLHNVLAQVVSLVPGTIVANAPSDGPAGFVLPLPGYVIVPLTWICVAGALVSVLHLTESSSTRATLILGVVVVSLVAGPAITCATMVFVPAYDTSARDGSSLLPGILLLAGLIIRNRWTSVVIAAYGFGLCIALIVNSQALGRV